MTFEPDSPHGPKEREAPRYPVQIEASIRKPGGVRFKVQVRDLSTHGFKIAAGADVRVGSTVWLSVPGLESLEAQVAWSDYDWAGCRFSRPLHPAVLDRFVAGAASAPR